jgi:hypothetical protein
MNTNTMSGQAPAAARSATVTAGAVSRKLTPSELEQAHMYLQQTRNYFAGAILGLSDEQWKFKPAPDLWSIAENVDHMVAVQELVLGPIRQQLASAPAAPADRDYKQVDAIVLHRFSARLSKFKGPDALQPTGQLAPAAACDRLLKNYEGLTEYLESTPDLREHLRESPPLKAITNGVFESMDGYQWILTAAAHTERHVKQILEVKAHPNFPLT